MNKPQNVDELIQNAPTELRLKLQALRQFIKDILPEAEERISYGMAFYAYKGPIVYFALQKKHIGLYIPPPIIENHKKDLANYTTTKSAVHLSIDKDLPLKLIEKLVLARKSWNEEESRS